MNYKYYKDKYKAITIKLDRQKDAAVIKYFEDLARDGIGAKTAICHLVVRDLETQLLINNVFQEFFKVEDVKDGGDVE